ncbi:MAG TPA: hypothetical protein DEQ47_04635 [Solibacterales bacterium]|nr:hypothetical protein [Bryobacterales bacterium]
MKHIGHLLLAAIAFTTAANVGLSAPAASLQLGSLLRQSDAVVNGSIESTVPSGTSVVVNLLVTRTIKGAVLTGTPLNATWTPETQLQFSSSIRNGESGIWFLKQSGAAWAVLPVALGAVPISGIYIHVPAGPLPSIFAYDDSLPASNRLADELAAAAQSTETAVALGHILASGAADDLGSNVLGSIWGQLASSATPMTQAIGLAGQIRVGNSAGLAVLATVGPQAFSADAQDHLSTAICRYNASDIGAIQSLGALVTSAYAENVKLCAGHALRAIHSKEAVKYLMPLLDSPSRRMQYEAVAGIASFANGFPVQTANNTVDMSVLAANPNAPPATTDTLRYFPTLSAFQKQPDTYISYWKNWLLAHSIN